MWYRQNYASEKTEARVEEAAVAQDEWRRIEGVARMGFLKKLKKIFFAGTDKNECNGENKNLKLLDKFGELEECTINIVGEYYISIPEINYFGEFAVSPNHEYLLSWCDERKADSQELGTYFLFNKNRLMASGFLQRPNEGKVANNGNFILHDWLFGMSLRGVFYAFDKHNEILIQQYFRANLGKNAISHDGRFAICELFNAPTPDGNKIVFFDLCRRKMLWKKEFFMKPNMFYIRDSYIVLVYKEHDTNEEINVRCSFDGEIIDKKIVNYLIDKEKSSFDFFYEAESIFENYKKKPTMKAEKEVIALIEKALEKGDFFKYPRYQAKCYRILGEICESKGNLEQAIKYYELALSFYPKIGVKRKLSSLKKKINKE